MNNITDKDKRFKALEVKIGVLVAAAVAGIIVIVIFIGIQKDIFTHKYQVYFTATSGAGFKVGMPVELSGFKIGRVKKIELTETANVKVTLEINKKYEQWVRTNSIAALGKEGFIGDAFIEIAVGAAGGRALIDGEEIAYVKSGGIEALVEGAKPILKEVTDIIHYINDPKGDLKASIANIKEFTSELKETRRVIDRAVKDIDRLVVNVDERAVPAMDAFVKTSNNLQVLSEGLAPLGGKVDVIMDKTTSAANKLETAMENVKTFSSGLAKETPRISGIITNVEGAASEGKGLIKGVREGWVGTLTSPETVPQPELIPLDAYPVSASVPNAAGPEVVK
ncbi:MAG: hypothetical protein A3J24_00085 [Deltaproteobacteria bacterium RIFCSPLOWO2_02_FULL_53_8]|nr:MAG: hypothetical protein A3J24_00085 [Deltaproteobacteria bacterium RIFCSPLOWO2_02_FULL_53_8]